MFDPIHMHLAAWAQLPFQSQQEMIAAIGHAQYRNPANDAYRRAVEAKMSLDAGNLGVSVSHYSDTERADEQLPNNGDDRTEQEKRRDELSAAEQDLEALHGPMAVRPAVRTKPVEIQTREESGVMIRTSVLSDFGARERS